MTTATKQKTEQYCVVYGKNRNKLPEINDNTYVEPHDKVTIHIENSAGMRSLCGKFIAKNGVQLRAGRLVCRRCCTLKDANLRRIRKVGKKVYSQKPAAGREQ